MKKSNGKKIFLKLDSNKVLNISIFFVISSMFIVFVFWFFSWNIFIKLWDYYFSKKNNEKILTWLNINNITWNIVFLPYNLYWRKNFLNWYIKKLSSAKNEILIENYSITEKKILNILEKKLKEWILIKVISEDKKYKQFSNSFLEIKKRFKKYNNFEIKSDKQMKTNYVHSKITIIDWQDFCIQTNNFTHSSFFYNREFVFNSKNKMILNNLQSLFWKDWYWKKIKRSDINSNLLVCNIDCRDKITFLLKSAKKKLIIQQQYIFDNKLLDIIKNKVWQWIEVKMLIADNDSWKSLIEYFWKNVVKILKKPYNHAKIILVDDKILLLWSMNLSSNSLDENREYWILINNTWLIKKYLWIFYKDWNWN